MSSIYTIKTMHRIIILLFICSSCAGQTLDNLQVFGAYGYSNFIGSSTRYDNPKGLEFGLQYKTFEKSNFFLHAGLSFIKTGTRLEAIDDSSKYTEHDFNMLNIPITLSYKFKSIRPEIGMNISKFLNAKTRLNRGMFNGGYQEFDGFVQGNTSEESEVKWNPFSFHYGLMFSHWGAHLGVRIRTFSVNEESIYKTIREYQFVVKYDL